jgi:hypothetical protein
MEESEFEEFCQENIGKITSFNVHIFCLEILLSMRGQVPAAVTNFAEQRKQQLTGQEDNAAMGQWRVQLWGLIGKREPEDNPEVAYLRSVLCLLFPLSISNEFPAVLLDDFQMFMEMAGDFESVFMSFRHLLLGQ